MGLTKASYSVINGAPINVLDYGAIGDAATDCRAAIIAADAEAASTGRALYFPSGVYRCSDGIIKTASNLE
jgi:polygalacturonase